MHIIPKQVPKEHFPLYVQNLVNELHEPVKAAIEGTLTGSGTLGTVLLYESLLSFLPTCCTRDQPTKLLSGYRLVPRREFQQRKRIDLTEYASVTSNGLLYISRPTIEKVWVPLSSLPASARATATQMLDFLDKLRTGRDANEATTRAADVIVLQFKHDLLEMGIVRDVRRFDGNIMDGRVVDTLTADQYVRKVFVVDNLPEEMSTRSFLSIAVDLLDPQDLQRKLTRALLNRVKVVPHMAVHARSIEFSTCYFTVLLSSHLSSLGLTNEDAQRLVVASAPLMAEYFPQISKKDRILALTRRPCLTRCVSSTINLVQRKSKSTRHLLAVTCCVAVMLAKLEGRLRNENKVTFTKLYRSANLSRFVSLKGVEQIVRRAMAGERYGLPECRISLNRV